MEPREPTRDAHPNAGIFLVVLEKRHRKLAQTACMRVAYRFARYTRQRRQRWVRFGETFLVVWSILVVGRVTDGQTETDRFRVSDIDNPR